MGGWVWGVGVPGALQATDLNVLM